VTATGRRRRRTLTRDELFEHALAIVDAEGLQALTMRRLARELGVKAPSLYNHVSSKEALVEGALSRMRSEMRLPDAQPEDWMSSMEAILSEYRRVLTAHPNMMPLAGRRLDGGGEGGLAFLKQQGFGPEKAVEVYQSLIALVVGFSLFSSQYADTGTTGLTPELGVRLTDWREETCRRTLRMIMQAYERERTGQ
jgi:AcrR family transcriptional regulator